MTGSEIIGALAHEAGQQGRNFDDWATDDDVQTYVMEHGADADVWQKAFDHGRVLWLRAQGWVDRWTTAPKGYDHSNITLQVAAADGEGKWRGLRQVLCDPKKVEYQTDRYASGVHGSWNRDPRVAEREIAERDAQYKADDEAAAKRRAVALARLETMSDTELDALVSADTRSKSATKASTTATSWRYSAVAGAPSPRTRLDMRTAWRSRDSRALSP